MATSPVSSRLDRLFTLLDTGSTPVIRKSAAQQIGQVQKLHPHELHNLLAKVLTFLRSDNWDTRIAAGQAIEAIARNVPLWEPRGVVKKEEDPAEGRSTPVRDRSDKLEFSRFDITRVLQKGSALLGSAGTEFDLDENELAAMDPKERLAHQKRQIHKRLGLDVAGAVGVDTQQFFQDEDLVMRPELNSHAQRQQRTQISAADAVAQEMAAVKPGMSAREKNRAKRKAKSLAKQRSKDIQEGVPDLSSNSQSQGEEPDPKRKRTTAVLVDQPADADRVVMDQVLDSSVMFEESEDWPFESFCEVLLNDLFSPSWEVRHGAGTGLREIVKTHGKGAGRTADTPADQLDSSNQQWLEDVALRLLCVFSLDRFGDFVSDEVVAPVRETCAQTLGAVLHHMTSEGVKGVLGILMQLLEQPQWEVRHGGLLGLKYLLAVRKELVEATLPAIVPAIVQGLQDSVDDVVAVAAASIVPVVDSLVKILPQQVPSIVKILWDALLELDDLTASTNSIMLLLASLLTYPGVTAQTSSGSVLTTLVPRLWPFLHHTIPSVRKASLETIHTLLVSDSPQAPCSDWLPPLLQDAFRHVFQRSITETKDTILDIIQKVWLKLLEKAPLEYLVATACPWLSAWLCLAMQPAQVQIDSAMLVDSRMKGKERGPSTPRSRTAPLIKEVREYLGGAESVTMDTPQSRDHCVIKARLTAVRLLGCLSSYIGQPLPTLQPGETAPVDSLGMVAALVVRNWAEFQQQKGQDSCCPAAVRQRLQEVLTENLYYDEITAQFTTMQTECRTFLTALQSCGCPVDTIARQGSLLTVEQASALALTPCSQGVMPNQLQRLEGRRSQLQASVQETGTEHARLEGRRSQLQAAVQETSTEHAVHHLRVQCSVASALVSLRLLPDKLNPIIRPLMDTLKKEDNSLLQESAARSLALLLEQAMTRTPCPNPKITRNLRGFACADCVQTPLVTQPLQPLREPVSRPASPVCGSPAATPSPSGRGTPPVFPPTTEGVSKTSGILTLVRQQREAAIATASRRGGRGRKAMGLKVDMEVLAEDDEAQKLAAVQVRGAGLVLTQIARHFSSGLTTALPTLWDATVGALSSVNPPPDADSAHDGPAQDLVNALQVVEVMGPALHQQLHTQLVQVLPQLCTCLHHPYTAVRHMAARVLGMLSTVVTVETMNTVLGHVIPMLGASDEVQREGAMEALSYIVEKLGVEMIPYIVLLVVPVLGRMSDQTECVRLLATQCFATLVRLMPLEAGIPNPPNMSADLIEKKTQERRFLEQLLDNSKVEKYVVPVPIQAELRKYQQDGVNWLAFLNKYKLHGILCDDMGLGKTLQSLCIVAGDHFHRAAEYKKSRHADCAPLPSIVVCPPTLTGHWVYEVEKFVSLDHLNPLHYTGPPSERNRLRSRVRKHNLVVVSYDIVRNDIDFFRTIQWNYCILDEGHIIKNGKTKISKAVKQLQANHRLILSGTPIQNNVLELWSLFDFLMPGFLGTEKQFMAKYGKPILQSRDAKSSSKEQEAGALAMEALHRQVLPFLLRRMKEDVLQDLPPKIIQDYYCELSQLQVQLYEDFAKSQARKGVEDSITMATADEEEKPKRTTHIFQALQYLQKVCNHPKLVLSRSHPEFPQVALQLMAQNSSLDDIQHSAKLTALRQLLLDCGIGWDLQADTVVGQHRALVFCQLKSMLDILEKDLLKAHMPSVTFLRLDGSIPAGARHSIVNRFNNDPSIDLLLLTTHVGGLGLNLTGADTVIFVEHDWNPMRDLQAMDRAHRLGQKKVVNVYRLVTQGTLEEKIMGLQKFKLNIANTVISQENSSLQSMGTDQLLGLFTLDERKEREEGGRTAMRTQGGADGVKGVVEGLGELWDQAQYETEYDLGNFVQSLT
ncbi:BTAF1 [Branchiostoma lanceolatum]|uniref:BTAF1 protein n=1 Tax=Branchiostoma lanceolatum TaxID=7740 RepID=A0A8K0ABS5_BRALA|nr:BTAF1 [Branchiostoma lanceolatum]